MAGTHVKAGYGWGLLLVTDDAAPGAAAIPSWTGDRLVTVSDDWTALAVRVRHAVDGGVSVQVRLDTPSTGDAPDFDGELDVPSGRLRISDADGSNALFVSISGARARVRIFCNAPSNPDSVDVVVG